MRQPLEDGTVTISRAAMSLSFPARFMLAAAMNPCPCGYFNDKSHECLCTPPMMQRYISKISGPLLDRIDIHIEVPAVQYRELRSAAANEGSAEDPRACVGRAGAAAYSFCRGSDLYQRANAYAADPHPLRVVIRSGTFAGTGHATAGLEAARAPSLTRSQPTHGGAYCGGAFRDSPWIVASGAKVLERCRTMPGNFLV